MVVEALEREEGMGEQQGEASGKWKVSPHSQVAAGEDQSLAEHSSSPGQPGEQLVL